MHSALVFVGGPVARLSAEARVLVDSDADVVIAVDSGLHLARSIDRRVDVVIGDMDSVDPEELSDAESAGAELLRHPGDKDQTDLELALDHALQLGVRRIVVAAGRSGRLDHLLGGIAVLSAEKYRGCAITGWFDGTRVLPVHDRCSIEAATGSSMSILAMRSTASVSVSGVRWPLDRAELQIGSTHGVSNVLVAPIAEVTVHDGCVVVVVPEEELQ